MTEWNDGRLDDFSKRVDNLAANTDARFDRLESKVDEGFARLDAKFDALHDMLFKAAWGLTVGLLTLVGSLIALIATKF